MPSRQEDLRDRTKRFAVRIVRFVRSLPNSPEGWVIGKQVLRSGTSVAANYRAAGRGRSYAEFTSKLAIVVEEADETVFWLELLKEAGAVNGGTADALIDEANQLLAIFAVSYRTAKARLT